MPENVFAFNPAATKISMLLLPKVLWRHDRNQRAYQAFLQLAVLQFNYMNWSNDRAYHMAIHNHEVKKTCRH